LMLGISPPGTTMAAVVRAALPYLWCNLIAVAALVLWPALATWLPGAMK